jgi:two-component system, LytTR family, sensor kinase
MNSTLNTRQKWWFCFAVILSTYVSGIYITQAVERGLLRWDNLPIWIAKLMLNALAAFLWFLFLEWGMALLKKQMEVSNWRNKVFLYYLISGVGMLLLCLLVLWAVQPYRYWFWPFETNAPEINAHISRAVFGLVACITVCGFVALANRQIWLNMESIRLKAEQIEKENLQSKLSALSNQVNPHFLFNSLSILSSLVRRDADRSERFILQLSKAYHYILERRESDIVTLQSELDFLQAYAYLLETRFEGKFKVKISIPETVAAQTKIAPLTLQLLVENAVKHNRMSEKEPLIIQIGVHEQQLVVQNPIRERGEHSHSTGVGLQNIINRYALLCDIPVWVGERDGNFVVAIPLLT